MLLIIHDAKHKRRDYLRSSIPHPFIMDNQVLRRTSTVTEHSQSSPAPKKLTEPLSEKPDRFLVTFEDDDPADPMVSIVSELPVRAPTDHGESELAKLVQMVPNSSRRDLTSECVCRNMSLSSVLSRLSVASFNLLCKRTFASSAPSNLAPQIMETVCRSPLTFRDKWLTLRTL